ncbi:hypothetical protein AB3N59_13215 [Leptospira sp. WS92.C1]
MSDDIFITDKYHFRAKKILFYSFEKVIGPFWISSVDRKEGSGDENSESFSKNGHTTDSVLRSIRSG